MQYYWVITQAEYATDLVFKGPQHLAEFFRRRQRDRRTCQEVERQLLDRGYAVVGVMVMRGPKPTYRSA
ncbi:MAG: hypothetical protein Q8Q58_02075 [Candidatus Rokubacteria bacterium]|nr:hypothetical protein [Candidatus Rokubacteria bacterium]